MKSMHREICFFLLAAFLLTTASIVEAQQAAKVPRIGFLSRLSTDGVPAWLEAFPQGLRELEAETEIGTEKQL
jgi:hypothetical protein